jgi:tripartite-type tricarboxylate transporter receptor subunit TctC
MTTGRRAWLLCVLACAAAVNAQPIFSQPYPNRAVTLVVPFPAGAPIDWVARTLAGALERSLGQPVLVVNRPGAGGTAAASYIARAAPDGYTLLIHHNGMATMPAFYRKLLLDPLVAFEPVGRIIDVPMTLLARKDLPAANIAELAAYAKADPKAVRLASAGPSEVSYLCGLLLQRTLGVEFTPVPFFGPAPALEALQEGGVDLFCDQVSQTLAPIRSGTVRIYGVTTRDRLAVLAETPTLIEAGLNDFEVEAWHALYAPKGTPPEVIARLNAALRDALKDPGVIARMSERNASIVAGPQQTPAALRSWLQREIARWRPVIQGAGVFAD